MDTKRVKKNPNTWGKTGFDNDYDDGYRDHVCKPVVVDANGVKRPIVAYGPNHDRDDYIVTTETITEEVRLVPQVTTYRTNSPLEVTTYRTNVPMEVGLTKDQYSMPYNNGSSWSASEYNNRPPRIDNFVSTIQTEASRPTKSHLESNPYWTQKPSSHSHNGINSYGKPSHDASNHKWSKPARDPYFEVANGIRHMVSDGNYQESHISTDGGWVRPTREGWSKPASQPLAKPTNNIGTAIDLLKDAAGIVSAVSSGQPQRQFALPTISVPKVNTYGPTIDSREAQKKYGGFTGTV
ncbi:hypothetical protein Syun_028963 [Stephania yunnanensis]|uniref:Uncharacterized protein n=1 Tax=Stephania yunnanensis TaxID=152371 RepID=A0AAP0E4Q2_9MAGN